MNFIHQQFPIKPDLAIFVATSGIPAPLVVPSLDEAAKIMALIYSTLGVVYLIKRLFWKGGGE